ncbi:MAG: hypothetical protein IMZ44_08800 [Planctomycetes bacterium]|nr:hypothetical protein [Planctomycetota bacterium]
MDRTHAEALSAFFDGERVDADLLAESLAQPGASALLAEFAAMRAQVLRDPCRPRPEFFDRMAARLRESRLHRLWESRFVMRALAASLVLAAGLGGFLLGSGSVRQRTPAGDQEPPGPAAITRQATALPQQEVPPPATTIAKPSGPRPQAEHTGPPAASLRLRFSQWRDAPSAAAGEGGRR